MNRNLSAFPAAMVVSICLATSLSAQDAVLSSAGYTAFINTTSGGLAPILARNITNVDPVPSTFHLRYGTINIPAVAATEEFEGSEGGRHQNIGGTMEIPVGGARLGLTAGLRQCTGCDTFLMVGAEWSNVISRSQIGEAASGAPLIVAIKPEVGFSTSVSGDVESGSTVSAGVSMPLALVFGSTYSFIPFVAPGLGWGLVAPTGGVAQSDVRPIFSGGVSLQGPQQFGLTVGFHKVFIDGGSSAIGIGLSWNR